MKTKTTTSKTTVKPSQISKAVAFMVTEVRKAGGIKALEHGSRTELFAKAAKKYDLAFNTCRIQWHRQNVSKLARKAA